jgi:hypothetical protein
MNDRGPVSVIVMPHNYRGEFYEPGEGPSFCSYDPGESRGSASDVVWATLPLKMPQTLIVFTDLDGRPIAAVADGLSIRWTDLDIVLTAVRQFNDDCRRRVD